MHSCCCAAVQWSGRLCRSCGLGHTHAHAHTWQEGRAGERGSDNKPGSGSDRGPAAGDSAAAMEPSVRDDRVVGSTRRRPGLLQLLLRPTLTRPSWLTSWKVVTRVAHNRRPGPVRPVWNQYQFEGFEGSQGLLLHRETWRAASVHFSACGASHPPHSVLRHAVHLTPVCDRLYWGRFVDACLLVLILESRTCSILPLHSAGQGMHPCCFCPGTTVTLSHLGACLPCPVPRDSPCDQNHHPAAHHMGS